MIYVIALPEHMPGKFVMVFNFLVCKGISEFEPYLGNSETNFGLLCFLHGFLAIANENPGIFMFKFPRQICASPLAH